MQKWTEQQERPLSISEGHYVLFAGQGAKPSNIERQGTK
jgi:hypothetical protein